MKKQPKTYMDYQEPPIIKTATDLLRGKVPDDLEEHVMDIVAIQADVALATADTLKVLLEKRKQLLWPKDKDTTELDRKTRLDADTAPLQRDYELLVRLEELLKQRVAVCVELLQ